MFHVEHISHIFMGIIERIKMYCEYKGITVNKFEVSSGIARGSLRYVKQSIGSEKLSGIIKSFPDLDISWLITGEGSMIKITNTYIKEELKSLDESEHNKIMDRINLMPSDTNLILFYEKAIEEKDKEILKLQAENFMLKKKEQKNL